MSVYKIEKERATSDTKINKAKSRKKKSCQNDELNCPQLKDLFFRPGKRKASLLKPGNVLYLPTWK